MQFKVPLDFEDEELTCGVFNKSGLNFAVGTSYGHVYFGNLKAEGGTAMN